MPIKTICKKLFVMSWICLFSLSLKNGGDILYRAEKVKIKAFIFTFKKNGLCRFWEEN